MKLDLRLRPSRPLNHDEAVGCFTANLALPGAGSLAAGRAIGYAQLAVTTIGFIITMAGVVGMLRWYLTTGGATSDSDIGANFIALWRHLRWPLFGLAVFVIALLWGMFTGWQILAASPKQPVPPRIP